MCTTQLSFTSDQVKVKTISLNNFNGLLSIQEVLDIENIFNKYFAIFNQKPL